MHEEGFLLNEVRRDAVLLVEGIDDARFFEAFLRWLGKTDDVQIAQVRGKPNFGPFLKGTLKLARDFSRLRRLGLIRDADESASSAFESLCSALASAQLPKPDQAWEIKQEEELHVSVAILPDMDSRWNLEELCLRSLEKDELSCIDEYVDCVTRMGPSIADHRLSKAKLYTYLAAGPIPKKGDEQDGEFLERENPGLRVGEAADAGVWDWDSPAFTRIREWLCKLAGEGC